MLFGLGIKELVVLAGLIVVLNIAGVWPVLIRSVRELRGDIPPETLEKPAKDSDVDLSCKMLGVSPHASWDEIEKAYRVKARVHHPDHGGDADAMRALNDAYRLLKQARKKK